MTRAFTLVVNPASGHGAAVEAAEAVSAALHTAGASVEVALSPGLDAMGELVGQIVARDRVVVSVGGDGMLASVAGSVSVVGGTLGIVPAGSGNDFARMLGLPSEPVAVAERLLAGTVTPVDLIRMSVPGLPDRIVAGSVYCGLDERATQLANRTHWLPKKAKYLYAGLRTVLGYTPDTFEVTVDGVTNRYLASGVVVANSAYYGGGMKIAPSADVADGVLDVVVIEALNRRTLVTSLPKVYSGAHVGLPGVHVIPGRSVTIRAVAAGGASVPVGGDGEPLGDLPLLSQDGATVEVLPAALNVIR